MSSQPNSTGPQESAARDDVTILIPAYNEGAALPETLQALQAFRDRFTEILVVDDCSTDDTAEVARRGGARVVHHSQNRGYGAALKTGAAAASTRWLLMFDADGQHPAASIPEFLAGLHDSEMVFGQRVTGSQAQLLRRPGKWVLGKVANWLTGQRIPDLNCGMRLVRREDVQKYGPILPEGFSLSTTMTIAALKDRLRVRWVPIRTDAREGRRSSVRVRDGLNTLLLILRVIMLFDPLKVFLPVSMVLGLAGVLFVLIEYFVRGKPQLSSSAVFLFLTTILVFLLGLVADQLAAIRRQIK